MPMSKRPISVPAYNPTPNKGSANSKAATTGSKVKNKSMSPRGRRSGAMNKKMHSSPMKKGY